MGREIEMIDTEGLADNQIAFIKALELHMDNVTNACTAAGISRQTFYRWYDESDIFAQAVDDVREGLIDRTESVLYGHIFNELSLDAAKYYLSRKGKKRGYVEKVETENSNTHTGSVAVICPDKAPMPDDNGNRAD